MSGNASVSTVRVHLLDRWGIDRDRLRFTGRTALVAFLAVALAWAFGLDHPQWAGMSVWAASQPARGHLLEKSLNRFLGTVVGALFGIALLVIADGEGWILVLGLSAWIGLCAGLGNLLRGFLSYGVLLSGYSAALVTLLHDPLSSNLVDTGLDRMATVLLGVILAVSLGWILAEESDPDDPRQRARRLAADVLSGLADGLADGRAEPHRDRLPGLLAEMGALEDELELRTAGTSQGRRRARWTRRLLSALVALLPWMHRPPVGPDADPVVADLREAVEALREGEDARFMAALTRAKWSVAEVPALADALDTLQHMLREGLSSARAGDEVVSPVTRTHRDWVSAREAGLRALMATAAAGAVWQLTGWSAGGFLTLGVAIMITVFSVMDNPTGILRFVFAGTVLGVLGALACRWLVWPMLGGEGAMILVLAPFMVLGALFFAHRRVGPAGFDYNMVLLLLLNPHWPLRGTLDAGLTAALAVVLGPAVAYLGYRFLFPVTARRRARILLALMLREVEAMAARSDLVDRAPHYQARLHHRVLKLARWSEKNGLDRADAAESGLAVMLLGRVVTRLAAAPDPVVGPPGLRRALFLARTRARRAGHDPLGAARALTHLAARADDLPGLDRGLLDETATLLTARAPSFREVLRAT